MLVFKVNLPPLAEGNPDNVVKRAVSVINESTGAVISNAEITDVLQLSVDGLKAPQNTPIKATLTDYDEVDNASTPRELLVTLADTIPPAQPGEFSIEVTGEVPD